MERNVEGNEGETGSRASNARRNGNVTDGKSSEQRATQRCRDRREFEREARDGTETGRTESRASSSRQNGNVTDGKLSEQRATKRKLDRREVERVVRDGTETGRAGSRAKNAQRNETGRWGKNGREIMSERTMLADHSKNSTKQP